MKFRYEEYKGIDIESLRQDLLDYYGSAMRISYMDLFSIYKLTKVSNASSDELIEIAKEENVDLKKYYIL